MLLSQNFCTLTPAWLLGKPSASSCKPSFLIYLTYSSKLSSPPICPDFLISAGSKWNIFLTPSQSNPSHGETLPTSWAREKTINHPLLRPACSVTQDYGFPCFTPSSFLYYTPLKRQRKKKKTTLFEYKFNQPGCNYDHPFKGLSKIIFVTAVPPSPGAGDSWELTLTCFAGVSQWSTSISVPLYL